MKIKIYLLFWLGLITLYFLTRLINLKIIPIFTDEAIYSYWAQVALHDPANRFISLEDGKQPLFVWLGAISQKFIEDPLVATRLISVFSGLGSLIGIFILAKTLLGERVAILSIVLYLVLPFTLLYDRLALFDSLLTMLGIYAVLFSVRFAKDLKFDIAILNGFAIGLAMITKSSGIFFLYLLPFSLLFFDYKNKDLKLRFLKWLGGSFVSILLSLLIFNSLRLSPLFYIIGRKNLEFVRRLSEVIANPFLFFYSNSRTLVEWIINYTGLPLFLIFVVAIIFGTFKRNLSVIYLSILVLAPFLAESFFNKVLYPRFILFYFPYLIILASSGVFILLDNFPKYRLYLTIIFVIFLLVPLVNSYRLLTNPPFAKIASSDAGQYFNDWPAGYGVSQIVDLIKKESGERQIFVGTEGTFGLLPYALQIYFFGNQNVHVIGFWPVDHNNLPEQIIDIAKGNKTYFVFNENQKTIDNPQLKLVTRYQKGIGNSFMRLYEVIPQ